MEQRSPIGFKALDESFGATNRFKSLLQTVAAKFYIKINVLRTHFQVLWITKRFVFNDKENVKFAAAVYGNSVRSLIVLNRPNTVLFNTFKVRNRCRMLRLTVSTNFKFTYRFMFSLSDMKFHRDGLPQRFAVIVGFKATLRTVKDTNNSGSWQNFKFKLTPFWFVCGNATLTFGYVNVAVYRNDLRRLFSTCQGEPFKNSKANIYRIRTKFNLETGNDYCDR